MKPSKKTHGYAVVFPKQDYTLLSFCKYSTSLEPSLFFPSFHLRYKALKIKSSLSGKPMMKNDSLRTSNRYFADKVR